MASNKEYRKYPNIYDAMEKFSDIVDLCDDCKDNLKYVQKIGETKNNIAEIKKIISKIDNLISDKFYIVNPTNAYLADYSEDYPFMSSFKDEALEFNEKEGSEILKTLRDRGYLGLRLKRKIFC